MTLSPKPRVGHVVALAILVAAGALVVLPAAGPPVPHIGEPTPFRWDSADLFAALEAGFLEARTISPSRAAVRAAAIEAASEPLLDRVVSSDETLGVDLEELSKLQFDYAVLGAAQPAILPAAEALVLRVRVAAMRAAARWPADRGTHEALYRVVFGGRIALEEAMIQAGPGSLPALVDVEPIPSVTPALEVEGVVVHSGDVLLSRGGAPTSALIARGSDFANTFSHAAIVHVDPVTGAGTVIESLIEAGSVLSTVDEYLESKKHRILLLRMRPDHPALVEDPELPHRAAASLLERLRAHPVPYDFAMRWTEADEMFCSEIVYHAFRAEGVELWPIRSAMTTPGLVRWLSYMGVREFTTLVPSDLEYDAQLGAVAEWRDVTALMDYRLDNAITDVLLEAADEGWDLGYPWYALPAARVLKAYSVLQDLSGARPKIPAGMSADAALRVDALVSTVNPTIKAALAEREARFFEDNGYRAPYWTLVELARESLVELRDSLAPSLTPPSP